MELTAQYESLEEDINLGQVAAFVDPSVFSGSDLPQVGTRFDSVRWTNTRGATQFNAYTLRKIEVVGGAKGPINKLIYKRAKPNGEATITGTARDTYIHDDEEGLTFKKASVLQDAISEPSTVTGANINQQQQDGDTSTKVVDTIIGSDTRTDFESDDRTGVIISKVKTHPTSVTAPTRAAGTKVSQKQIRENRSTRIVETIDQTALLAWHEVFPTTTDDLANLPPVLVSVSVEWAENSGEGDFATDWNGLLTGNGSISGNESGSSESSASCIPEVIPVWSYSGNNNVPTELHIFAMEKPCTRAAILARLSTLVGETVTPWPVFKQDRPVFSLVGGKKSVMARASASASLSVSDSSNSHDLTQGTGGNYDVSVTHARRDLGFCLHDAITLGGDVTKDIEISAVADVGWTGIGDFPSASATKTATATISGQVTPTTLSATSPAAIPSSGFYLMPKMKVETFPGWTDYAIIAAEIPDASLLA